MKNFWMYVVAVLIVSVPLFAATSHKEKKKKEKQEEPQEVIVNYEVIQQGTYSGKKDADAEIIDQQAKWEQLWKQHVSVLVPQPPVPEIDFTSNVVAVIFAGEKTTGGYAVVIKDVVTDVDDVVVHYRLTEPQPNSFTLQVICQPYVMLRIAKPKGTVKLVKE
jgi:protease stability complex PrcB-like protein